MDEDCPLILVTNDDGVYAQGIRALAAGLETVGRAVIVAPDREMSATSHSITLHHPLRVSKISERRFSVDGTPTDCVLLGTLNVLPRRPDLVVSGINRGGNFGEDVLYSGTVSVAMEGAIMGLPAFAISVTIGASNRPDLCTASLDASAAARWSLFIQKMTVR